MDFDLDFNLDIECEDLIPLVGNNVESRITKDNQKFFRITVPIDLESLLPVDCKCGEIEVDKIIYKLHNCKRCYWKDCCKIDLNNKSKFVSCDNFQPNNPDDYLRYLKCYLARLGIFYVQDKCGYFEYELKDKNLKKMLNDFNSGSVVYVDSVSDLFELVKYVPDLHSCIYFDDSMESLYIER